MTLDRQPWCQLAGVVPSLPAAGLANVEAAKRWCEKALNDGDAEARSRLEKLLKESSNANP